MALRKNKQIDFEEVAEAIDLMRESIRAMVASLVDDGFTDEQARILVVSVLGNKTGGE